jgi:hypothetical protein
MLPTSDNKPAMALLFYPSHGISPLMTPEGEYREERMT